MLITMTAVENKTATAMLQAAGSLMHEAQSLLDMASALVGGKKPEAKLSQAEPKPPRRKKRHLSPEGRARIIAATKKMWAAKRAAAAAPAKAKRRAAKR
jgi:hypothetical protein